MKHVIMKIFALPVVVLFVLVMASFSVATSYAANSNGGFGVASNVQSIDAVQAAKLIQSNDAVVVDLRDKYTKALFNVSAGDTTNMDVQSFLQALMNGQFDGMPVVGIVDGTNEGLIRQVLGTFSSALDNVQLFLTQLNPKNANDYEKAGLTVNTFENISFDELPGYAALTKSVAQASGLAAVQTALEAAIASPTEGNVARLDTALKDARLDQAIDFGTWNQLLNVTNGAPNLQTALTDIQSILFGGAAPTPPVTPTPTPAPTPGVGGVTPAPVPPIGGLTPPAPAPVPGEGGEVVPPTTPVAPVPGVTNECLDKVYAIVSTYPDLENYDVRSMASDVVSSKSGEDCKLYDLVSQVNDRVEPIYSDMVSTGLFANLLHRRDIINYDKALDNGLRQAALADGRITDRQATVDEKLDKLYRNKDARHRIPLGSWLPTWVTTYPRDIMIRVLRGRENPVDAIGNALNDPWTNGINFPTGRAAKK
jgi:hypothetical protein